MLQSLLSFARTERYGSLMPSGHRKILNIAEKPSEQDLDSGGSSQVAATLHVCVKRELNDIGRPIDSSGYG